jgi:hypothetical protein
MERVYPNAEARARLKKGKGRKKSAKGVTLFMISIRSGRRHNGQDSQDIFVETIYSASSSVSKSRSNSEAAGDKGESIR